ncbi:hypothetical protein ZEAMMB73_Zm00001d017577 [Zea mays]|uniref:Ubiquitin-like protease family profile domain-containing protein n=1 Tax=Zea mays TaxID=4577 RepID=A0A1D6HFU1_MAIZE|nr:hypothetical protein ZEAMMB73_Zm00001d017577 [Zea mays]
MACLFQLGAYLGDEVFIPINIRGMHWYLTVINARNIEIQVLDSLGTTFDRNDLTDSIKGQQRQINMVSQRKELKDHSSSCGLFILNYIEYWTGDELSDSFTQDDMSHFRKKKLAAILLSSYMNKRRGYLIYKYDKEVHTGSPSDVEILDSPTNHKKRKLLHVLDNSEVLREDEDGLITQADLQRWFVDEWDKRTHTKVSMDGCTDDFLMSGLFTKDMPVTKADLIDVLCDYIMAIQDDRTLESAVFAFRLMMVQSLVNFLLATIFIGFASINGCTSMPHAPYASTMFGKTLAEVAVKKYKSLWES